MKNGGRLFGLQGFFLNRDHPILRIPEWRGEVGSSETSCEPPGQPARSLCPQPAQTPPYRPPFHEGEFTRGPFGLDVKGAGSGGWVWVAWWVGTRKGRVGMTGDK